MLKMQTVSLCEIDNSVKKRTTKQRQHVNLENAF